MGTLPVAQYLEFEAIRPLREYTPLTDEVKQE
jgi:hypothetical protein